MFYCLYCHCVYLCGKFYLKYMIMRYVVEFEVQDGNCELYKLVNPNDCESACRLCPLKDADYCMDFDMHKAKVVRAEAK